MRLLLHINIRVTRFQNIKFHCKKRSNHNNIYHLCSNLIVSHFHFTCFLNGKSPLYYKSYNLLECAFRARVSLVLFRARVSLILFRARVSLVLFRARVSLALCVVNILLNGNLTNLTNNIDSVCLSTICYIKGIRRFSLN